jgi:hypothetical protein
MKSEYRNSLERLKSELEQMQAEVPAEAVTFQRDCKTLLANIVDYSARWFVGVREIRPLEDRTEKLRAISLRLKTLVHRAQKAANDVAKVRENAAYSPELSFLLGRCDEWMRTIHELGRHVNQERHLQLDELKLLELENVVGKNVKSIELLGKAQNYCRTLPEMEVAVLKAMLPKWNAAFRQSGPTEQSLAELESLLDPLQKISPAVQPPASRAPIPSPLLWQSRRMFDELRAWGRELNRAINPSLDDSYRRMNQGEIPGTEAQEVLNQLVAEVENLRTEAAQERAGGMRQIRQDAGHFRRACGENTAVDQQIALLGNIPADTPQNYKVWKLRYQETNEFLFNIAKTREDSLSSYLKTRAADLEERRQRLALRLLSRKLRNGVVSLGGFIAELTDIGDELSLRKELRASDAVEEQLSVMEKQAAEELAAYRLRKSSLVSDLQELHQAASAFEQSELIAASSRLLEEAQEPDPEGGDLDAFLDQLASQVEQYDRLCANFLRASSSALMEIFDYCRQAHLALSRVDEALGREAHERRFALEPPHPSTPGQAKQQLETWSGLRERYRNMMDGLMSEVVNAVASHQKQLEQFASDEEGYLTPEQRDQAGDLIASLEQCGSASAWGEEVLPHFTHLAGTLIRSHLFIRLIEGEREEVRKLHEELKSRLRRFREDESKNVFPDMADRISALVYGVDPQYLFSGARRQLEFAGNALNVIEQQAVRQVAEDLASACEQAVLILRNGDGRRNEALQTALDEVGEYAPQRLAPASVRRRLMQYTRIARRRTRD